MEKSTLSTTYVTVGHFKNKHTSTLHSSCINPAYFEHVSLHGDPKQSSSERHALFGIHSHLHLLKMHFPDSPHSEESEHF